MANVIDTGGFEPVFGKHLSFEKSGEFFRIHETATGRERYKLKARSVPQDVHFGNFFYADVAMRRSEMTLSAIGQKLARLSTSGFRAHLILAVSVDW
jgi:hypothetical protein